MSCCVQARRRSGLQLQRGLALAAMALAGLGCGVPGPEPGTTPTTQDRSESSDPVQFLLGGIQVNEPNMGRWHTTLLAERFNTLSLTVYARQGRWDSADLQFDPDQLGGDMINEIRAAKRAGLNTVLILRVGLEHALEDNTFLWHGLIQPKSDADLDAWFDSYGEFVRRWAVVAEAEGVDILGVGSELSSLTSTTKIDRLPGLEDYYLDVEQQVERRERTLSAGTAVAPESMRGAWGETFNELPTFLDRQTRAQAAWAKQVSFGGDVAQINARRERLEARWRTLIGETRQVYSGALTYAANFDQFEQVGFWDALDVIGINAYFPLRTQLSDLEVEALFPALVDSWRGVLARIESLRSEQSPAAPVVFTELGYTRWRGSTIQPWAGDGFALLQDQAELDPRVVVWRDQPLEPQERTLAVRALREAVSERPGLLRGLLYWKLSTVSSHTDIEPFVLVLDQEPPDPLIEELVLLSQTAAHNGQSSQLGSR